MYNRREFEQRFTDSLLPPAGASNEQATYDTGDMYSAHERPWEGRRIRAAAFPQHSNPLYHSREAPEKSLLNYEGERRQAERNSYEQQLYQAVQPGNNLNRHVTGEKYAQQLMADIAEKKALEEQRRMQKREADRIDEERVAREREHLLGQVNGEIERQRQRHKLVEQRDAIAARQYQLREEAKRAEKSRHSTASYFEERLSAPSNPHQAKLLEMRAKRWEMESRSQNGGRTDAENSNPNGQTQLTRMFDQKAAFAQSARSGRAYTHGGGRTSIDLSWG